MEQLKTQLIFAFKYHSRKRRENAKEGYMFSEGIHAGALMQVRSTWNDIKFLEGK